MKVLAIDIGGTHLKLLATGQKEPRKVSSGPGMTPRAMVSAAKTLAQGWPFDVISIGYPGLVLRGQIAAEPHNLAPGWRKFDFQRAFGCPVKLLNDAAMQALGSYQRGHMLFLGLGTGLGSAMVVDGVVVPMELCGLSYKKGTFEDYTGLRGLERFGRKKWERHVHSIVGRLFAALHPGDLVLGGGNAKKLKSLPPGCRIGENANAFIGGFRLWEPSTGNPGGLPAESQSWNKTQRKGK